MARSSQAQRCQRVMHRHRRCTVRASLHSARTRVPSCPSPSNVAAAVAVAVSLHVSAVVVSYPANALETPKSAEEIVELVASGEVDEAELDALIKRFNDSRTGSSSVDTATAVSTSQSSGDDDNNNNNNNGTGSSAPRASAARSINGGVKAFRYEPPPQKQGTHTYVKYG